MSRLQGRQQHAFAKVKGVSTRCVELPAVGPITRTCVPGLGKCTRVIEEGFPRGAGMPTFRSQQVGCALAAHRAGRSGPARGRASARAGPGCLALRCPCVSAHATQYAGAVRTADCRPQIRDLVSPWPVDGYSAKLRHFSKTHGINVSSTCEAVSDNDDVEMRLCQHQ